MEDKGGNPSMYFTRLGLALGIALFVAISALVLLLQDKLAYAIGSWLVSAGAARCLIEENGVVYAVMNGRAEGMKIPLDAETLQLYVFASLVLLLAIGIMPLRSQKNALKLGFLFGAIALVFLFEIFKAFLLLMLVTRTSIVVYRTIAYLSVGIVDVLLAISLWSFMLQHVVENEWNKRHHAAT
ncbi:hypothetical protein DRN94_003855 [archaeon]|nr:hypothetical protein [archaeon]